jgi:NADH dehydrogenase
MVRTGSSEANEVVDSAGSEVFKFEQFVRVIASAVGRRARVVHVPTPVLIGLSGIIGALVRDVVVNQLELSGLMRNLMVSSEPARSEIHFSAWLLANAAGLGRRYANELSRHYR